jgi:hypothetical protein
MVGQCTLASVPAGEAHALFQRLPSGGIVPFEQEDVCVGTQSAQDARRVAQGPVRRQRLLGKRVSSRVIACPKVRIA